MSQDMKIFQGSMVAMATPMQDDGTIDYPSLNNLVDFHLQHNTDAIVPVGTTGESATLNNKEHAEVIKRVVQRVNKRIPVLLVQERTQQMKLSSLLSMLPKLARMLVCLLPHITINQHKKVCTSILRL